MKLLVAGGAGYIGGVVTRLLLDAGHEVVVLDDLSTGRRDSVPDGVRFVQGRVHDVAAEVLDSSFDGVLHFAAFIEAGESVKHPEKYWENNLVGSLRLLDAMRSAGVRKIVFSSTAGVYGDPDQLPIVETAAARPPNPYGASKLAVDLALSGEATAYGIAAVSLRYFNVAGAHRCPDGTMVGERHDPESHLIPIALQVAAGKRDGLQLYGGDYPTPDGTCLRDYIHITDLARAHLLALSTMDCDADPATGRLTVPRESATGGHRIYNLGSGTGFSNREVVEVTRSVTGRPVPFEIAPRRAGDPASLVASSEKARVELGWVPQRPSLPDIVSDAWEFYRRELH
ncbi:UDP-glucose 4-epimerase GalE [Rugosimonospora acidiphila]|uniref:UDP-glucose 4-epimerase n=1 Tax=Rugosimonospora acidiphila TaxID=556531 RepID=A0ABP9SBN0_9ACTN